MEKGIELETLERVKRRTEEDLEFLQMLTCPQYINFLIDHGFFEDDQFSNYLKYLQYLKDDRWLLPILTT